MINLSLLSTIEEVFNTQWLMKYYSLQSCFFVSYLLVWEKSYAFSTYQSSVSITFYIHNKYYGLSHLQDKPIWWSDLI